jgi:hypothetical protein
VAGKTVTETFPHPTALRKAQQEVVEFHRFQSLARTWPSTKKSVDGARSSRNAAAGRSRKKNGCCNPSGGGAGSKPTPPPRLCMVANRCEFWPAWK